MYPYLSMNECLTVEKAHCTVHTVYRSRTVCTRLLKGVGTYSWSWEKFSWSGTTACWETLSPRGQNSTSGVGSSWELNFTGATLSRHARAHPEHCNRHWHVCSRLTERSHKYSEATDFVIKLSCLVRLMELLRCYCWQEIFLSVLLGVFLCNVHYQCG
jgi:hypothetical protein